MTGKLCGPSVGEKPAKPASEAWNSDQSSSVDDNKILLKSEGVNEVKRGYFSLMLRTRPLSDVFPERTALCVLAHFGFVLLYIMRSNMSVALVRMTGQYAVIEDGEPVLKSDYDWTMKEQGIILSSFFIGYILTQIPGGYLAMKYGGRITFGSGLFLASVVSILTPACLSFFGFYGLIIARILCGLFEGVTYPAIHAMWNFWAPPKERSTLVSFAFAGAYVGAALSMGQNNGQVSPQSWSDLFYISGCYALLWCFIWFTWGAEYPETDPLVSKKEMKYLQETVGSPHLEVSQPIPWSKILLSQRVWAISFCHFAANWGFYTILTELPVFLTHSLCVNHAYLAKATMIPFAVMAISAAFAGLFVDRTLHRFLDTTATRKATVAVTFMAQMILFFLAAKATENYKLDAGNYHEIVAYISTALFFGGMSWAGFGANHLDIAPDYASVLLGITNTFGTIPGIVSPIVTGMFVRDNSNNSNGDLKDWSMVFLLSGYIYMAAAVYYVLFGSGERQDWANPNESVKLNSEKKSPRRAGDVESASEP